LAVIWKMTANEKKLYLTYDGLKKLEEELEYLRTVRRAEVAERIKRAKEFGDLSENAEYDEAKKEQAFVEGRIITLEKMLAHAQIIETLETDSHVVSVGRTVRLLNLDTKQESEFTIVGSFEANPKENRISDDSPLGKELIGKKLHDFIRVKAPAGEFYYQIVGIK
jgi:transcription elongation factor GreA